MRKPLRRAGAVAFALAAAMLLAEAVYWNAARLARDGGPPGDCAVLVLGYPSRGDGGPHPMQELRVAAGVRALREHQCASIVVSGGAAHGPHVEADAMAAIAESLGVAPEAVIRERAARTTIENVELSLPLVRGASRLYVASDGVHAHRGVRIVCRTEPARCARTFAVGGHEPLAMLWWKAPAGLHELRAWLRDDDPPRHAIAALALAIALAALAALHVFWAIAGVPANTSAVPTRDGVPLVRPGRLASLAVALALFAAAALVVARAGWLAIALPAWMPRAGTWAIAAVFAARAIGEGRYLGFAKRVRDTAFARLDTWLFSPICVVLAALAAIVASSAA